MFKKIKNKIKNINEIFNSINEFKKILDEIFLSVNALSKEILLKKIKYCSYLNTLNEIINTNKSFIRFGDGELFFMLGSSSTCFEKFDKNKSEMLLKIWNDCHLDKNIMIGVDDFIINPELDNMDRLNYYNNYSFTSKISIIKLLSILSKKVTYYSQQIFALPPIMWSNDYKKNNNKNIKFLSSEDIFFNENKNYSFKEYYLNSNEGKKILLEYENNYFLPIKNLFKNKTIILITSKESKFGENNNIFSLSKKLINVWCDKDINSCDYIEIIDKVKKLQINKKETICVVSYGVIGKIICLNVHNFGIRTLDMGSFSAVYDYYNNLNDFESYNDRNNIKKFNSR